jgi:hypothetical protein
VKPRAKIVVATTTTFAVSRPTLLRMDCDPARVTVDVTSVAEPIAGEITADGQVSRAFNGWLQMISVLQDALESLRVPDKAEEDV